VDLFANMFRKKLVLNQKVILEMVPLFLFTES